MKVIKEQLRRVQRGINLALDPLLLKQARLMRSGPLLERVDFDAFPRPHFAYGVCRAAQQAKALGIPKITAIEFGCAGGNGLIELENVAKAVSQEIGIDIDIYGFDMGEGLPMALDYRDLPYAWQAGHFKMNIPALEARLTTAKLVLGNVSETVEPFCMREDLAPIGFVSFDLDYYSSTVAAFKIFDGGFDHLLPRVYCYFDDCIGPDHELHCEYVGELLAIKEFNERDDMFKLAPIHGLSRKRIFPATWNDVMYIMHAFSHPLYTKFLAPDFDLQLSLED